MSKKANKALLNAVLEPRRPGAMKAIEEAIAAGADPDGICPDTSTSSGPVRGGSTLLTHSIEQWSSKAAQKLLECGADPSLEDENGWTPWMASTLVDASKRSKIQAMLEEHGADKRGEHIGELAQAIASGNADAAEALIQSDNDLKVLATFRVDLVGHQIRTGNAPMLKFLLRAGMEASSTNFLNAIRNRNPAAVDVLLQCGFPPETSGDVETPLMTAAGMGEKKIVQRLVEGGADVNRSADDDGEWTPSFYARQAGHDEVADWLQSRMDKGVLDKQAEIDAGRDPRFALLYERATAGESVSTDELVAALAAWDERFGVTVRDASGDSVSLEFEALPKDLDGFVAAVIELCPDAIDGKKELTAELRKSKTLFLWWD